MGSLHAALVAVALSAPGQTVLYDFYADWCGPCRAMDSVVAELAAKGCPVQKVNVDRHRALAEQYGVTSIPCFVMVVDGREVDRVVGGTTLARLEQMAQVAAAKTSPRAPSGGVPRGWESAPPRMLADAPPRGGAMPSPPPGPTAAGNSGRVADEHLVAATVKLRVHDGRGSSLGSGTIIDAQAGEALILTCGHIFRDSEGKGRIEVELFGPGAAGGLTGRLIAYDLEADLGLVAIRPPGPVAVARVAPPGHRPAAGQPVVTAGCNRGDPPNIVHTRITSVDRCAGPPNLQVAGQSVTGRSGGGIFTPDGLVIGVCFAAEPQGDEAYCTALAAIHDKLAQRGLEFVYDPRHTAPDPAALAQTPPSAPVETSPPAEAASPPFALPPGRPLAGWSPAPQPLARGPLVPVDPPPMAREMPSLASRSGAEATIRPVSSSPRSLPAVPAGLTAADQAALDELRARLEDGAEVICVVRSRKDPAAPSEVILLEGVSAGFVDGLLSQAGRGQRLIATGGTTGAFDVAPSAAVADARLGAPEPPAPERRASAPFDSLPFRSTPLPWR